MPHLYLLIPYFHELKLFCALFLGLFGGHCLAQAQPGTSTPDRLKNGLKEGVYKFFYPNGHIQQSATYHQGQPLGKWKIHDSLGRCRAEMGRWGLIRHGPATLYDPITGSKLLEMSYLADLPEGKWLAYHPGGDPALQGWLRDGTPHGTWRAFAPDGQPTWRASFQNGQLEGSVDNFIDSLCRNQQAIYAQGKIINVNYLGPLAKKAPPAGALQNGQGNRWFYAANGQLRAQATYVDSLLQGDFTFLDDSQRVYLRLPYRRGQASGQWRALYANDTLAHEGTLVDGQLTGKFTQYRADGKLLIQGEYQTNQEVGNWQSYHANARLASQYQWVNGQIEGRALAFHPDGIAVAAQGQFLHGEPIGHWEFFSPEKTKLAEGNLTATGPTGPWKFYFASGQLASQGTFTAGQRTGAWRIYHPASNVTQSAGTYRHDQMHGEWQHFHPNSQLAQQEVWDSGKLQTVGNCYTASGKELDPGSLLQGTGTRFTYHTNGKPAASGNFSAGLPTGYWLYFDEKGRLSGEGGFSQGLRIGQWRWYHQGKLEAEGHYDRDLPVGQWKIFDAKGRPTKVISF